MFFYSQACVNIRERSVMVKRVWLSKLFKAWQIDALPQLQNKNFNTQS